MAARSSRRWAIPCMCASATPTSATSSPICARCRRRSEALFLSPHALAHRIVDIGGGEIVGDEVAVGRLRERFVHAPLQDLRQRKAETVAFLQRSALARQGF